MVKREYCSYHLVNVLVINKAVGDKVGESLFEKSDRSRLGRIRESTEELNYVKVPITTLDVLAEEIGIQR